MNYMPHLDGLRAMAALAVVAFHAKVPGFSGGFIGVDLFFVLSGYLITRVLQENDNLLSFYIRRARRLLPPLALMLAAYIAVFPIVLPDHNHFLDALLALIYVSDYSVVIWDMPEYIKHTWSLSVEEHFYLLWPLLLLRFHPTARTLFLAYLLASLWRWEWIGWDGFYYKFDTRLSGLILGCWLASTKIRLQSLPAWPGLLTLAIACATFSWMKVWVQEWGLVVVEMAAAVAIIGQPPKWLSHPYMTYLGRLSYGIYLWHYPIVRLARDYKMGWEFTFLVSLLGAIFFAAISYHLFEPYFRRTGNTVGPMKQHCS